MAPVSVWINTVWLHYAGCPLHLALLIPAIFNLTLLTLLIVKNLFQSEPAWLASSLVGQNMLIKSEAILGILL